MEGLEPTIDIGPQINCYQPTLPLCLHIHNGGYGLYLTLSERTQSYAFHIYILIPILKTIPIYWMSSYISVLLHQRNKWLSPPL